jgi:TonB family protein
VSILKSMQRIVPSVLIVATLTGAFGVFWAPGAQAQDAGERKVRIKVEPQYPEIARKMGLTGVVKLEIVVAPNGSVKETKVIGGHPILVNATVDAVKKWKFESASAESTESRDFKFEPGK